MCKLDKMTFHFLVKSLFLSRKQNSYFLLEGLICDSKLVHFITIAEYVFFNGTTKANDGMLIGQVNDRKFSRSVLGEVMQRLKMLLI